MIKPRMLCEAAIGLTQIVGQALGSTTFTGACIYEFVTLAWWAWMFTGRMWGFLPINIAGAVISTWNLFHA
jgi:hypothetical protein